MFRLFCHQSRLAHFCRQKYTKILSKCFLRSVSRSISLWINCQHVWKEPLEYCSDCVLLRIFNFETLISVIRGFDQKTI